MARKLKILVACGSGIATSSVAKHETEKVCAAAGYDVDVTTTSIAALPNEHQNYDVICTTCPYHGDLGRPTIRIFGLISNINRKKVEEDLIAAVKEAAEKL
ncbi:MAG: hypothetical protein IJJ00_03435 [Erysipelotrichaceae bacterium]|nr:hypothetical protein [Erysipelotrichaceae bacterium]